MATQEVFKAEIHDKLKENGEKVSRWEDRGYIWCGNLSFIIYNQGFEV